MRTGRSADPVENFMQTAADLRRSPEPPDEVAEQSEILLALLGARALIKQAKAMLMATDRISARSSPITC